MTFLTVDLNQKAKIKKPKLVNIPGESSTTVVVEENFSAHYLFTVTCINTQYYYVGLVLNGWQAKGIIPIIKSNYISVTYNNNTFEIFNTNSSGMDFMYSLVEI